VIADGEGILVTDEPLEFARHVVDMLRDSTRRVEMARRARAAAEANYRWEDQLARLDQVIAAVSQPLPTSAPADRQLIKKIC
jgi:glycosyltransferase involved in cell wall biosynthesis